MLRSTTIACPVCTDEDLYSAHHRGLELIRYYRCASCDGEFEHPLNQPSKERQPQHGSQPQHCENNAV